MEQKSLGILQKLFFFSFALLFFLTPFAIFPTTSELFELNKMWIVWGFSIFIAFLWSVKIIISGKVTIQRTPLDIPLMLFLASQMVSTVLSIDPHVSLWGYYSRFNGGLLSILAYIFLYYAFASNLPKASYKVMLISLLSGAFVTLWGLPSYFGYDPTCLVFRGTFDVSCWTESFQPKVRIFSTFGQPNWLAAYLAILLPISIAFAIKALKETIISDKKYKVSSVKYYVFKKELILTTLYLILTTLFYLALTWTSSQSGFLGFWVAYLVFFILYALTAWHHKLSLKTLGVVTLMLLFTSFFLGTPVRKLDQFTFNSLKTQLRNPASNTEQQKVGEQQTKNQTNQQKQSTFQGELGGSDSGKIRLIVWRGAFNIFKQYPLFGSGVETFAYAYYKARPVEHNTVSEWEFLYNKAHNEYLNYLATTGGFGLGSYILLIGWFLVTALKKIKDQISKIKNTYQSSKTEKERLLTLHFGFALCTLSFALIASYLSILISNFFGFSVVMVNLYFFFLPLFFYDITESIDSKKVISFSFTKNSSTESLHSAGKMVALILCFLLATYLEFSLARFWLADKHYALGYNLNRINDYVAAYQELSSAVKMRSDEDLFKDELSSNLSILSLLFMESKDATNAAQFGHQAKQLSDEVVQRHPQNVVYLRTRARVLYAISDLDASYLDETIATLKRAHELAPTDPKILYNLGLLYGQTGSLDKGMETLLQAIKLKQDYRDPRYTLALFYSQKLKDETDPQKIKTYKDDAISQLTYILKYISPEDKGTKELLQSLEQT